jgi:hypothetical protein
MKRVTPEESHYYIKLPSGKARKADAFTLIKEEDGWDRVIYLACAVLDPSGAVRAPEYVYVLVNKSVPNMVKIGMTTSTPDERARQISTATGVATPWIPVYSFQCYRSDLLEEEVHHHLREHRVNKNREMFAVDSHTAQRIIEEFGYKYSSALWEHNGHGK